LRAVVLAMMRWVEFGWAAPNHGEAAGCKSARDRVSE
jgi:hypothetical protein